MPEVSRFYGIVIRFYYPRVRRFGPPTSGSSLHAPRSMLPLSSTNGARFISRSFAKLGNSAATNRR